MLISFESPLLAIFALARDLGVPHSVLVLNIDWCHAAELRELSRQVPGLAFWAKGPASAAAIREALADGAPEDDASRSRDRVAEVPWTIPDRVVPFREPVSAKGAGRDVTFLMIVGMGGVQSRRGVDIALRALAVAVARRGDTAPAMHLMVITLEATEGQILSQSTTDATRFWWHLHGSRLEESNIRHWVAFRVGLRG